MAGTILVVDDSDTIRTLMLELLLAEGFQVATAADGHQALNELTRCRPDLVLLDIEMPGLNGYEVCRRIKGHPETRELPVVLVSGITSQEGRYAGFEAGADDYLSKPFFPGDLLGLIGTLLRSRAAPGS